MQSGVVSRKHRIIPDVVLTARIHPVFMRLLASALSCYGVWTAMPRAVLERVIVVVNTIIIVDDDQLVRRLLRRILTPLRCSIFEAADGEEALALIRRAPPTLVLLDLDLPRLDGWGVLRACQADPVLAGVPVVLVTGNLTVTEVGAREAGARAVLRKPFSPAALRALVVALTGGG
jgi:CheY-like chemotaxis protein